MLFDLRSKGRRRVVKISYGTIALIFLVGFIFAGVGTGLSGNFNFFEAVGSNSGGKSFGAAVEAASKRVKREPSNPAAWSALLTAQLHEAGEARYTNQTTGSFTAEGRKILPKLVRTWEGYLQATHDNPSVELSKLMLHVLGEEGIDNAPQAVAALQVITAAEPNNDIAFYELAQYAYQAGNTGVAELAAQKALALAPSAQRAHLKGLLKALKEHGGHLSGSEAAEGAAG